MGYLRRTSNYSKRIILSNPTLMMSMVDLDPVAINVEIPRIDRRCSLEKEPIELIRINP